MTSKAVALRRETAVATMTTEALRDELAKSLEITARHLTHLAAIWRELEHRGEDLSHLRSGLWAYMPLIASGRLRAEIVVQYAGHTMLLRRLADLPHAEQDALLQDNTVLVIDHDNGKWRQRRVPITHLRGQEVAQVIGDHIRTPEEQKRAALARSRIKTPTPRARTPAISSFDQIVASLPLRRVGAAQMQLNLGLSPSQREAIEQAAADRGLSPAKLAIASLIHAGLIPEE